MTRFKRCTRLCEQPPLIQHLSAQSMYVYRHAQLAGWIVQLATFKTRSGRRQTLGYTWVSDAVHGDDPQQSHDKAMLLAEAFCMAVGRREPGPKRKPRGNTVHGRYSFWQIQNERQELAAAAAEAAKEKRRGTRRKRVAA